MKKIITLSMILFFMFLIISLNQITAAETTFYVAKDGNDLWTGKLPIPNSECSDGPFATLEKARDAIRQMKENGELQSPVTVMVRGGTYYINKTFTLEARDSGTRECPITYRTFPGEKVVLSGGKKINAEWRVYNGKIMVCDIPEVKNGDWYFRQLFINGKRQIRSRIPNGDYFHIAGGVDVESKKKTSFKFHAGDIKRWSNLNDVEIVNLHSWDEAILKILDIDETTNVVSFTGPTGWGFTDHQGLWGVQRYYVENVFEGLDIPGEWYLNRHTGELFYYPIEGENITDVEIVAPALIEIIHLQGDVKKEQYVQYVTISGFTLSDADWFLDDAGYPGGQADVGKWQTDEGMSAAVVFEGAENCVLKNNVVTNAGLYAVSLGDHCQYNSVEGNEIKEIGAGGIKVGTTDRKNYSTKRNLITNNHIYNCGIIYNGGVGIWIGQSAENTVSHNEIHDINYSGMSVGWTWSLDDNPCYGNIIEFNKVYRVVKNANDGGCIYTLGKQPGTVIRNNIFHDVKPYHHMAWGIYLDGESSNITVINNIMYRCEWGNSMSNPGKYNLWINNILVNSGRGQLFWGAENEPAGNRFIQNIVYYSGGDAFLMDGHGAGTKKKNVEMDYNLFYYTLGRDAKDLKIKGVPEIETLYDWQKLGFDFHSVIADPLFVDAEHDNFTLKSESPAFKLGFKQIDVSKVGLLKKGKQ